VASCAVCGKEIAGGAVKCAICGAEMHRDCAKKISGKFYCRRCSREGKRRARYERMAQRAMVGKKLPKKLW